MRRTVALICLLAAMGMLASGPAGAVAAESQPAPSAVPSVRVVAAIVDSTTGCPEDALGGLGTVVASPGRRVSCIEASDPRLTGRVVMDTLAVGGGMWRASVIVQTATGDWRGSASGYQDPDGTAVAWMMLGGAGGLAGLTAMLRIEDGQAIGLVVPGELKDVPPPVDPTQPRA